MEDLLAIEKTNRQAVKSMQIAISCANKGQTNPLDIFNNKELSNNYKRFLHIMGINDDMPTINNEWRGHSLIWHMAHNMDEEQVRRCIGNTQCVIIFNDTEMIEFDPKDINEAGNVVQFFVVIQPWEEYYRVGIIQRITLKPFGPPLPYNYLFREINIRDFILTKIHNGYMMSRTCPPFAKMYEYPRSETIKTFAEKWINK